MTSPFIEHRFLSYILSQIDFENVRRRVNNATSVVRIVLIEFQYPKAGDPLLIADFIPNTNTMIHDLLQTDFLKSMNEVIGIEGTSLYTRRKIADNKLTNTRQLIMYYDPFQSLPPLVPEGDFD
jgi:hypothetical protein